jgi:signal transduction histidine kinase
MKLSRFIVDHIEDILAEWVDYAGSLSPAADSMSVADLRDHGEAMLRAVALDIDSPQSAREQIDKSLGEEDDENARSAASRHGHLRQAANFTLLQLSSEFRALRASVLRQWLRHLDTMSADVLDDVIRFNEAIDQALAESIVTYSARAEQSRNVFDAILGHDLRGPLSSITLAGEMLARPGVPGDKVVQLGINIKRSAHYMTNMVEDMLAYSRTRLDGTSIPVHTQPVDLAGICADAMADAQSLHPKCSFELHTEGRMDARLDPDRMRQLLVNLLANAGQHGNPGCAIRLHAGGDDHQTVLRVVNQGPQIPADFLDSIFEALVHVPAEPGAPPRAPTSLGLGLHIARKIATAHGGSIDAESNRDWTTFRVQLPRQAH